MASLQTVVPADRVARIAHNLAVVQSRTGWTKADALKAIADAKAGVVYRALTQRRKTRCNALFAADMRGAVV